MTCKATMKSMQFPDHTHVCSGEHDVGDHMCKDPQCRRWFYEKPKPKPKRVRPRRARQ